MQMQDYAKPYKPFRSQATRNNHMGDKIARLVCIAFGTLWIGIVLILMVVEFFNQFN